MHAQLHEIIDEFKTAQSRLHALARRIPDTQWGERSAPGRWSVSENVEHLNMFSARYLPIMTDLVHEARALGLPAPEWYHRGVMGWMLWRMMPPPVRMMRGKAIPSFVPNATLAPQEVRDRFDRFQHELIGLTASADGLPIDKVMMTSPVAPGVRYNLFAAFGILARHQHRHLWQAEQSTLHRNAGRRLPL